MFVGALLIWDSVGYYWFGLGPLGYTLTLLGWLGYSLNYLEGKKFRSSR